MRCIFPALLPAFLVALFGAWCGTFSGGAELTGSAGGEVALLGFLLWVGADLRDPLRLGSAGRLLPAALWIAAAASCWASPVPRAGWVGLILLPAYLALPGAVERAWRDDERDRRIGLRALAVVAGVVALGSLLAALQAGASRSAMPLGHHNLLAAWLVILLPLALQPAREPGRWRWLGVTAGLACFGAVLACRSLAGSAALLVEAAVLLPWRARGTAGRRWGLGVIAVLVLAVVAAQGGRLAGLLAGADPSLRARAVYWRAGVDGFLARPLLGWGPGSTAWSLASFLHPVPGVNPPGELVGELHSLPVALSYELGATGLVLALALAALFCRRRIAELQEPEADRPLLRAGLAGLAGAAVAALGSAALAITALPLAAAVAAGAALAARPRAAAAGRLGAARAAPIALYALAAAILLLPLELARWHYQRATAAASPQEVRSELGRAVRLDPSFPLYRARLGWSPGSAPGRAAGAATALEAAEDAGGVAVLWLFAGADGLRVGAPWAPRALSRACALDPLSPFAPFLLAAADPGAPGAAVHAAHALLAEPRLAAATFWQGRPDLLSRALDRAAAWPGVDPRWRRSLAEAAREPLPDDGSRARLALAVDAPIPSTELSLHLFRRRPWPAERRLVEVRRAAAERLALTPATTLSNTAAGAFVPALCNTP
ncbi:MAG TPA: O-antigen ligase family protein [Thermoanaerobaculia bacterium]|nr:O-antigen ligase family protein [Thermoanaerobaculia bacterium]